MITPDSANTILAFQLSLVGCGFITGILTHMFFVWLRRVNA